MRAIALAALLIYTFGAFAFGALAAIWGREVRRIRSGQAGTGAQIDVVTGALIGVSVLWFCTNLGLLLTRFTPLRGLWQLDVAVVCLAFAFPPIIMHMELAEARSRKQPLAFGWRPALLATYAAAVVLPITSILIFAGPSSASARQFGERLLGVGLSALFVGAALYSVALRARAGQAHTIRERQARRWTFGLFGLMILLFLAIMGISLTTSVDRPAVAFGIVEVMAKSLPLMFFFVASYHENRFEFFDLFVKRGVSLIVTIAALTAWFAASWAAPWLDAIVLLPLAVSLPWIYARLGALLDRRWLGRRFSTIEAVKHFFGRLRSATTEALKAERPLVPAE